MTTKRKLWWTALASLGGLMILVGACGDDDDDDGEGFSPTVSVVDFGFDPLAEEVAVGDSITWVNEGETQHTVTSADGRFESGPLEPGDDFEFEFEEPGRYDYFCTIHPDQMNGSVNVVEEGSPDSTDPLSEDELGSD